MSPSPLDACCAVSECKRQPARGVHGPDDAQARVKGLAVGRVNVGDELGAVLQRGAVALKVLVRHVPRANGAVWCKKGERKRTGA